jgi:HEAT repeat protein
MSSIGGRASTLSLVLVLAGATVWAHGPMGPPMKPKVVGGSIGGGAMTGPGPGGGSKTGKAGAGGATQDRGSAATAGAGKGGSTQGRSSQGGSRTGRNYGASVSTGFGLSSLNPWELWWDHNKESFLVRRPRPADMSFSSASGAQGRRAGETEGAATDVAILRDDLVQALQDVLRKETEAELCDSAVLALARVSPADTASLVAGDLRRGLTHETLSVRTSSTLALGVLGATQSLPLLNALMTDSSAGRQAVGGGQVPWNIRAYAALSLGLVNQPLAVEPLLDIVQTAPAGDREVRCAAAIALGLMQNSMSSTAVSGLLQVLEDRDADPVVRACAANALSRLDEIAILPAVLRVFRDPRTDQVVRQSIAQSLGRMGSLRQRDTVDALLQSIAKDSDAATRQFAWIALARMAAPDRGAETEATRAAIVAVLRKGIESPERIADRSWAALAAGLFGRAQSPVAEQLREPLATAYAEIHDPSTKGAFAIALGLIGARAQAETILADLRSSDDEAFRGYAAASLGLLGHGAATADLVALCRDVAISDTVRQQVASAIAMLRDDTLTTVLLEELAGTDSIPYASSVSRALGQLRDPASITPLVAIVRDAGQPVVSRAFACVALGLVADKQDLRFNTGIEEDYNYLAGVTVLDEIAGL